MLKKLGKLSIHTSADYYDKVAKALEKEGFILVLECETSTDKYYIVAKDDVLYSAEGENK